MYCVVCMQCCISVEELCFALSSGRIDSSLSRSCCLYLPLHTSDPRRRRCVWTHVSPAADGGVHRSLWWSNQSELSAEAEGVTWLDALWRLKKKRFMPSPSEGFHLKQRLFTLSANSYGLYLLASKLFCYLCYLLKIVAIICTSVL